MEDLKIKLKILEYRNQRVLNHMIKRLESNENYADTEPGKMYIKIYLRNVDKINNIKSKLNNNINATK